MTRRAPRAARLAAIVGIASAGASIAAALAFSEPAAAGASASGRRDPPSAPPVAATAPRPDDGWKSQREHWYQLRLNDQPCGWMTSQELRASDGGARRSINESCVRFGRSGAEIEVTVRVVFDETASGDPIRCEVVQQSGRDPIRQTYSFDPSDRSKAAVVSSQGGRRVESTVSLPKEPWLTPLAAEAFAAARRRAEAPSFRLLTLDPSSGMKAAEIVAQRGEASRFTAGGREIPVTRWTVDNSLLQVPSIEEWSTDDVLVRSVSTLPIGRLEAVLADRAAALGSTRGPAVELMVKTIVRPDRPIDAVHRVGKAKFRISTVDGNLPDLPSVGAQRSTRLAPNSMEVVVDDSTTTPATAEEIADAKYRRASVSVDSDDPLVRELAANALESFPDALDRVEAEALRRAVHRHIRRKVMSAAFASASETVRSREGDCTEHAVLLAALLRAEGIPSRVMTGLVYCPEFAGERNVFGWHMWTQALIDGAWVDLDATLPDDAPFHGAHIATGWSAQEQGAIDSEWAALVTLIGNLRIEVLESARRELPVAH